MYLGRICEVAVANLRIMARTYVNARRTSPSGRMFTYISRTRFLLSDDSKCPITPYIISIVEITCKCYSQVSEAPRTIEICDAVLRVITFLKSLDIMVAA